LSESVTDSGLLIGVHLRVRSFEVVTITWPTREVFKRGETITVSRPAALLAVVTVLQYLAIIAGLDNAAVRRGYLRCFRNVFPQLGIKSFGVDPFRNGPVAGSELNAAFMFAQVSIFEVVLFVGTGTASFERVHTVFRTALRGN